MRRRVAAAPGPAVLGLAVVLAVSSCTPEPGEAAVPGSDALVLDRVHDLVALADEARVVRSPFPRRSHLTRYDDRSDARDGIAYLRVPPPSVLIFEDLATSGPATLRFACGVGWSRTRPGTEPVTFRIEARDLLAEQKAYRTVFERTLRASELPEPERALAFELELGTAAVSRWELRLTTEGGSRQTHGDWPAWIGPQLRSAGRSVPRLQHPVRVVEVSTDLLGHLAEQDAEVRAEGSVLGVEDFDAGVGLAADGGRRRALVVQAPARVSMSVDVPVGGALEFAVAVRGEAASRSSDGMRFAVAIDGSRLWESEPAFSGRPEDRGWRQGHVDLSAWAGKGVELHLVAEAPAVGTPTAAQGAWANVRVLSQRTVERRAAGAVPNVFVIVIDTLRADHLGCYGAPVDPTPNMDAMAARGVLFVDSRSVSSWTAPATASLFTGVSPYAHGVQSHDRVYLADELVTLSEVFASGGYTTGAFIANPILGRDNNFHQGFETFVGVPSARARSLNERVLAWLDNNEGSAVFGYVHYLDPHSPYFPPADWVPDFLSVSPLLTPGELAGLAAFYGEHWQEQNAEAIARRIGPSRRLYEAEVAYVDAALGELIGALAARGLLEDALVVVTSDHGEEFYEHGSPYHGDHLYEESLRVPLWITGYGRSALEPQRVQGVADLRGVLPTLDALLDLDAPDTARGAQSLLPRPPPEPKVAVTFQAGDIDLTERSERSSILLLGRKLIHTLANDRIELYDVAEDAGELNDLAQEQPQTVRRLLDALNEWRRLEAEAAPTGESPLSEETLSWMRELGYLEGR